MCILRTLWKHYRHIVLVAEDKDGFEMGVPMQTHWRDKDSERNAPIPHHFQQTRHSWSESHQKRGACTQVPEILRESLAPLIFPSPSLVFGGVHVSSLHSAHFFFVRTFMLSCGMCMLQCTPVVIPLHFSFLVLDALHNNEQNPNYSPHFLFQSTVHTSPSYIK